MVKGRRVKREMMEKVLGWALFVAPSLSASESFAGIPFWLVLGPGKPPPKQGPGHVQLHRLVSGLVIQNDMFLC